MEHKLTSVPAIAEPEPAPAVPPPQAHMPLVDRVDQVDLRLVIEQDEASGTFIYKTINRRTGEVVLQLPREDIVRMRAAPEYQAGDVIQTKV
jgi:flagellar protein FlaG